MDLNHTLSGIPDAAWYRAPRVAARRIDNGDILSRLLETRDDDQHAALNAVRAPPPSTSIFALTRPLEGLIRDPIMREFNMGVAESRAAAYRWMVAFLRDNSVARRWGIADQANTALLTGIEPRTATWAAGLLELANIRFRSSPLTSTSVWVTIHGDIFPDGAVPDTKVEELEVRLWEAFHDVQAE
jgi:hypothetical protein